MDQQVAYKRAKARVEAKLGFLFHLLSYVVVSALLYYINISTSSDYLWYKWPVLGWGIGVLFHALHLFVYVFGIMDRMIESEISKATEKQSE